jgi:hypothetical protein
VAASADFKKVREDLDKVKKRGKMLVVGDLLKDKEPKKKAGAEGEKSVEGEDEDENANLSREERKKKYFKRADVLEAVNVAADLVSEVKTTTIKIGSKAKPATPATGANDATPSESGEASEAN